MADEIQLISDGDGLAVLGDPAAVERFLSSAGVSSKQLGLQAPGLGSAFGVGAGVAQAGSEMAANAGRWVKLTEESAKALKISELMKGSSSGVSRAVLTDKGKIKGILELVRTPGSMLTNPAVLAGAAGIMAQLAMQQAMDEITDYLAVIDEKVDDILRAQKDSALADMIAVGSVLEGHDHPRAGGSGLGSHLVKGAGNGDDDCSNPGVRVASAGCACRETGSQDESW